MKNKILLVNLKPNYDYTYDLKGNTYPASGLLVIGTVLKRLGYDIRFVDQAYDENYMELIRKELTDDLVFAGFSVMTSNVSEALKVGREIKAIRDDVKIIWGGPHPTFFWESTVRHPVVDIAVVNEGVKAAKALAQKLAEGGDISGIKGIAYKRGAEAVCTGPCERDDIEEIGALDVTFYPHERYTKNIFLSTPVDREVTAFPILTGLGCAYKCSFCVNVVLERRYRYRSPESIIAEIKDLQARYGATAFHFMDEDFFINKKRLFAFFRLVEKEGLKFYWRTWMRAGYFNEEYVTPEVVEWLAGLGWRWTSIGAESGSQEILDMIEKRITLEQILNSAKVLRSSARVWTRYTFIVGLPGETAEQIRNTFRFAATIKRLNGNTDIDVGVFRPYPGSPLTKRLASEYGFEYPDTLDRWSALISRDGFLEEKNTFWIKPADRRLIRTAELCVRIINRDTGSHGLPARLLLAALKKIAYGRLLKGYYGLGAELSILGALVAARGYLKRKAGQKCSRP